MAAGCRRERQLAVRCRPGLLPDDLLTQAVFAWARPAGGWYSIRRCPST
ncbi:hypothetical protein M8494_07125 [Serratia ureilytica]